MDYTDIKTIQDGLDKINADENVPLEFKEILRFNMIKIVEMA